MSALGSAVINKSSKKFAPKAPARRTAQISSTQVSATSSVDRQAPPQTPHPQSAPGIPAVTPVIINSLSSPTLTQSSSTDIHGLPQDVDATRIPIPSRETRLTSQTHPQSASNDQDLLQTQQSFVPDIIRPLSGLDHPDIVSNQPPPKKDATSGTSSAAGFPRNQSGSSSLPPTPSPTVVTSLSHLEPSDGVVAPAAKRRKVDRSCRLQNNAADHDRNVPIPSTEPVNDAAEILQDDIPLGQESRSSRETLSEVRRENSEYSTASTGAAAHMGPKDKIRKPRTAIDKAISTGPRDETEILNETQGASRESESQSHAQVTLKKHRQLAKNRKKKRLRHTAAGIVADAVRTPSKKLKNRGRRCKRSDTPEGAENIEIMPSEVRMMDLCTDVGNGKKSEREIWLREYDRAEFVKAKQRELQAVMGHVESTDQAFAAEVEDARLSKEQAQHNQEDIVLNVPNTIIVNGQIQIDETSLQIDRHAAAAAERNLDQPNIVEENPYTRKVNSGTWLRRDKSGGWNELLVDRFYEGLRMFGTDFEMISRMFPGKTRHSVKLKFCKEEKTNLSRITAALSGERVLVDLDDYQRMTGTEYGDPEDLEREIADDKLRLEEEQIAEKEALEAAAREREEQIAAERVSSAEDVSHTNVAGKRRVQGSHDRNPPRRYRGSLETKAKGMNAVSVGAFGTASA